MESPDVHLHHVADERQPSRTGQVLEATVRGRGGVSRLPQGGDIDPELGAADFDRARHEASGPVRSHASGGVESPSVISADECASIHLAFAEQRSLVRTATLICAKAVGGSNQHEVEPVDGDRERTLAGDVGD